MRLDLNESRKGLFQERKSKVIPCRGAEPTAESLVRLRSLEAESIRSRVYEYGRVHNYVKLKTIIIMFVAFLLNARITFVSMSSASHSVHSLEDFAACIECF